MRINISKAVRRALGSAAVLSVLAAGIMSGGASQAAQAAPAAGTSQMAKTCEAYSAWYYHRTTANIDAMMAGTFSGTWTSTGAKYVLQDAGQLYMDVRAGAALKWVNLDIHYLGTDCNKYVLNLAALTVSTMTPAARTCTAFRAWQARPTPGRLNTMVRDSLSAPWANLGRDVAVVYFDVRDNDRTDLAGDVAGVTSDCR